MLSIKEQGIIMHAFHNQKDITSVFDSIDMLEFLNKSDIKRAVFLDCPPTSILLDTIKKMLELDIDVVVRDHHDILAPANDRERQIAQMANEIKSLLKDKAIISDRKTHPSCLSLVEMGEFIEKNTVIICDPDSDGVLTAMKSLGTVYQEILADSVILDGPKTLNGLSKKGLLLAKAISQVSTNQKAYEIKNNKEDIYSYFIKYIQGSYEARLMMFRYESNYDEIALRTAKIFQNLLKVSENACLLDLTKENFYNIDVLNDLVNKTSYKISVIKKSSGPLAERYGAQYSLSILNKGKEINLQDLLQEGFKSSIDSGIISNSKFLLHINEKIWETQVLPKLKGGF